MLTGFECDVVVAVVDYESGEGDIGSIDRVCTIGVEVVAVSVVFEVGAVDVDVLHQHFARVDERHRPHLALDELDALHHRIGQAVESDLVWSTWVITNRSVFVVPDLAVAVEGAGVGDRKSVV